MNGSRWALHVKLRFVCTPIACCLIIQKDLLFPLAERMDNHNRRLRRDGTFVIGANPDGTLPSAGNSGNGSPRAPRSSTPNPVRHLRTLYEIGEPDFLKTVALRSGRHSQSTKARLETKFSQRERIKDVPLTQTPLSFEKSRIISSRIFSSCGCR